MNEEYLYICIILKDSFFYKGKIHTGFYDGSYRKIIKQNIENIKNKTSLKSTFKTYYEIMDFPDSTQLRINFSVPKEWSADRFEEICLNEIQKNPSIEIIAETFLSSSPETKEKFFTKEWKGMEKVR